MILLYSLVIFLSCVVIILTIRVMTMSHALSELTGELDMILQEESNILLTTSSGDRSIRRLVERLNVELGKLVRIKSEYSKGILDLKCSAENVAHDIRTPLTVIKGYVELLEKEEIEGEGKEYLEIIKGRVEYMKSLSDELFLSLSMKNRGVKNLETIECRSVLEEALVSFYVEFEKKHMTPRVKLPEEKVMMKADSKALYRVYVNIISNALKYGEGELSVGMDSRGNTIFSNLAPNMDRVDVNRLLDRYYTIKDGKSSSGIGLSISKEIVEEMGGKLKAKLENEILYISISF